MINADSSINGTIERAGEVMIKDGGLTKREHFALIIKVDEIKFSGMEAMGEFIGREINQESTLDIIKAQAETDAKIKVIYADALLKELEK